MIRAFILWWNVVAAYPSLGPSAARELTLHAIAVETDAISAELLIGMSWIESKHQPNKISRARGGWFCGLVQANAKGPRACSMFQDPRTGLEVGVIELESWLRLARGNVRRMLAGHGCGYATAEDGRRYISLRCGARRGKPPYHVRVLAQMRRLQRDPIALLSNRLASASAVD